MNDESSAINMVNYWVSSSRGTCWVQTRNGIIVDTAALWRKFKGQPIDNLTRWLRDANVVKL